MTDASSFQSVDLKRYDHFGDPGVGESIILKLVI
jgi:hypothetical protein